MKKTMTKNRWCVFFIIIFKLTQHNSNVIDPCSAFCIYRYIYQPNGFGSFFGWKYTV